MSAQEVRWLALTEADWRLVLDNLRKETTQRADEDRLYRQRRQRRLTMIRQQIADRSGR